MANASKALGMALALTTLTTLVAVPAHGFWDFWRPAPPVASEPYQWIVENNRAIGCVEKAEPAPDEACLAQAFPSFTCLKHPQASLEKDLERCRARANATAYFLGQSAKGCAEFAEDGDGPRRRRAFLRELPLEQCTHGWVELDPETKAVTRTGRFLFHPSGGIQEKNLIPELLALEDGQLIPQDIFAKHDSRLIGATLTYRRYLAREKAEVDRSETRANFDFLSLGQIQLAFGERNLDSILEKGFLNQHQTHRSHGTLNPALRAAAEDKILGLRIELPDANGDPHRPQNQLRPKYAYYGLQGANSARSPFGRFAKNYGHLFAVLKNQVKDRTTITDDDSLRAGTFENTRTPRAVFTIGALREPTPRYTEAQIWGEVTLEDVSHFLVNCPSLGQASAMALAKLKATGKPVYQCREEQNSSEGSREVVKIERGPRL